MIVRCLFNSGLAHGDMPEKHLCKSNHYGIAINTNYMVMGIHEYNGVIYYLTDYNGYPRIFPNMLFEVIYPIIPPCWHYVPKYNDQLSWVLGYKEYAHDDKYQDDLILSEEYAMKIYFERKKEIYGDSLAMLENNQREIH